MKTRRVLWWALAVAIVLGMFSLPAGAAPAENFFSALLNAADAEWIGELKWFDLAGQATGVSAQLIAGPGDPADFRRDVEARILGGTVPDAVVTSLTQIGQYGPKGAFANLAPLLPVYAPNIQAYMDLNPDYKALVTDKDGAVYGLALETPAVPDFIGYRADHFREAGIDPARIRTVDDFTRALRTLKAFYGSNDDYHPLCGYGNPIRFAAWFGCASSISAKKSGGVYAYGHHMDGSFDILSKNSFSMAEAMQTWYKEGLIDPDWVDGALDEAEWKEDVLHGNGSVFYDDFRLPQWFMDNRGPETDPDFEMGVLNFLTDSKGRVLTVPAGAPYDTEAATAVRAGVSEEKAAAILSFLDFFFTDEGRALTGAIGEGDVTREAAKRLLKPENLRASIPLKFSSEQSEELSYLVGAIYRAEVKGIVSFINGSRLLFRNEWATFQLEMVNLGLKRIEQIQLDAFRAAKG